MAALMRAHPLATLIHTDATGTPVADVLPMLWTPAPGGGRGGTLRGHVARANPLWRQAAGQEVLVLFHGPQAYVSPGWYPSKAETGKAVPTWNYSMVQARGRLVTFEEPDALRAMVADLTDTFEATQASPWSVDDAPPDYLAAMLKAIVGVTIEVEALQGKFKLSQNRPAPDHAGVVQALEAQPATRELADWMRKTEAPR